MSRKTDHISNAAHGTRTAIGAFGILDPFEGGDMEAVDVRTAAKEGLRLVDLMGFAEGVPLAVASPSEAPAITAGIPDWAGLEPGSMYAKHLRPLANLALLTVVIPVLFALSLPIALANLLTFRDPRLVFYSQDRMGQFGRVFRIYKFRTMRPVEGSNFAAWSNGDKNRVTVLGRFLRSTHLDEIPQIFNILLGDMDFIGPRPEMVEIHDWAVANVAGFERRLVLRPGITGLAQITQGYAGQCTEAYAEKLAADDVYRENMSAGMDLSILFRTVAWMARGRGWSWNKK